MQVGNVVHGRGEVQGESWGRVHEGVRVRGDGRSRQMVGRGSKWDLCGVYVRSCKWDVCGVHAFRVLGRFGLKAKGH